MVGGLYIKAFRLREFNSKKHAEGKSNKETEYRYETSNYLNLNHQLNKKLVLPITITVVL